MGRCVYTGIYEPGHPGADEDGLRTDVLELVRELGVSTVRYPGGNFVSGYRWEDGVGPREGRPVRLDPAWNAVETNEFGLDEFVRWARKAGVEPMLAVNLGTRGVQEALDLLEYANHPAGTELSDRRVANGSPQPHGIRLWCLGNELDGPWQLGHKTAEEYGRLAVETASAMRQLDPSLTLVACGSSHRRMPTFAAWEATVLEHTYDEVDLVSAHAYYQLEDDDLGSFLASGQDIDETVAEVVAAADHVRAKLRRSKRIDISFDEWNVWYRNESRDLRASWTAQDWEYARRLSEEAYTTADAVVVGSLLIALLRHSDRVTAACQAQLVNTIAPIRSEPGGPAWRQTIFHPFAQAAALARGEVLQTAIASPTHETRRFGAVSDLDAVVTVDREAGSLAVLAVNRSPEEPLVLDVDLRAFGPVDLAGGTLLHAPDWRTTNTQEAPDRVQPRPHPDAGVADGRLRAVLPAVSWSTFEVRLTPAGG